MLKFMSSIPPIVNSLFFLVVGAFGGAWATIYVQRPRVRLTSIGGGGILPNLWVCALQFQNLDGFFGLRLGSTTFLGLRLLPPFSRGLPIPSSKATQCHAWLYDEADQTVPIGLMHWRIDGKFKPMVDLDSRESAELLLFVRPKDDERYYPNLLTPAGEPALSAGHPGFTDKRDFRLIIRYSNGQQKTAIRLQIRPEMNGGLRTMLIEPGWKRLYEH